MIIIRRKHAETIDEKLINDSNIVHFEITYRNERGNFVYNHNKGDLKFIIKQLEKENREFIIYISKRNPTHEEKVMFDVKGIGMVVMDNTFSKVADDEIEMLVDFFEEYISKNKIFTFETCFNKYIAEATEDFFIDDNLNITIFKCDGNIINRHYRTGTYSSNKKLWVSNAGYNKIESNVKDINPFNDPVPEKYNPSKDRNDYEMMTIDILDANEKLITDEKLLSIGRRFKTFLRSCHNSMSMSTILEEFKKYELNGMNIDLKVNVTSYNTCELIIDDMPTDLNSTKDEYATIDEVIDAYLEGKCIIPDDFEIFTKLEIRKVFGVYPMLFSELLKDGYSILSEQQIAEMEEMDSDDEYQATKKEELYDPISGVTTVLCLCYHCEEENYEQYMTEYNDDGKWKYICKDCLDIKDTLEDRINKVNEPVEQAKASVNSEGF